MHESNEREFLSCQRVANRSIATAGVPTQQALRRESHAGQGFDTLSKGDVLGEDLHDVRTASLVQDIG